MADGWWLVADGRRLTADSAGGGQGDEAAAGRPFHPLADCSRAAIAAAPLGGDDGGHLSGPVFLHPHLRALPGKSSACIRRYRLIAPDANIIVRTAYKLLRLLNIRIIIIIINNGLLSALMIHVNLIYMRFIDIFIDHDRYFVTAVTVFIAAGHVRDDLHHQHCCRVDALLLLLPLQRACTPNPQFVFDPKPLPQTVYPPPEPLTPTPAPGPLLISPHLQCKFQRRCFRRGVLIPEQPQPNPAGPGS